MAASSSGTMRCQGTKRKREGAYRLQNGKQVWQEAQDRRSDDSLLNPNSTQSQDDTHSHSHSHGHGYLNDTATDSNTVRCEAPLDSAVTEAKARTAYLELKRKLSDQWATLRQQLGDQFVRNAYPATFTCSKCTKEDESICRCPDCGPNAYFCHECMDNHHRIVLLHVPEKWNTEECCFQELITFTTWTIPDRHICDKKTTSSVIIIDDKGRQHYQALQLCDCKPIPVLMLQYGLWPASPSVPRVAFTIDFMLTLKAIVLEGQISLHAFCTALQACRPGLRRDKRSEMVKDLYRIISWETVLNFMWVHHYVSYLQFAGPFPDGTTCTACPKQGDNKKRRIAMDGNMNLVRRAKAGHSVRTPMHEGRFFLPQASVDEFVNEDKDTQAQKEQSCSRFQAGSVIRAKNKTAKLQYTGVFASVCCHDFPCAILNMRFGERMAYPIFMMQSLNNVKVLLYDLGCQLDKFLEKRDIPCPCTLGVPIFHIYGHIMSCQLQYSPRSMTGAGLFDGEGTERLWSYLGRFSVISKEMTPENRQDILTEAMLQYGHRLEMKMGDILGQRLGKAYVLQETTKKTLTDELLLLDGVTVLDVVAWNTEEKTKVCQPEKDKQETWQGTYAMQLYQFYTHCEETGEDEPDEETARLEGMLKRIERRHTVRRRWTKESMKYKDNLKKAYSQERVVKLSQLHEAVQQYTFMVTLKSRCPRGQSVAHRVKRQLLEASKKVNQALATYNKLPEIGDSNPPHRLQRSDVTPQDAPVWQYLSPVTAGPNNIAPATKRKLIDACNLNLRAREEIKMTSRDLAGHLSVLVELGDQIQGAIDHLESVANKTDFEKGSLALLVHGKYRTYAKENEVRRICDKIQDTVDLEEFMEVIHRTDNRSSDEMEVLDAVAALEQENEPYSLYEPED